MTYLSKKMCSVPGCARSYYAKGFCEMHYARDRKGLPLALLGNSDPSELLVTSDVVVIKVRGVRGLLYEALVDLCDLEKVSGIRWRRRDLNYIYYTGEGGKDIYLHRMLLGASKKSWVDHIDGDPLNNRRTNLRICSPQQNAMNRRVHSDSRTGVKGVTLRQRTGRFEASICLNGKAKWLGSFNTKEEAGSAYDRAAKDYFGEFARLNYPSVAA